MTAHMFIVDQRTFLQHQKYGFAGTGDGSDDLNVKMAADMIRVRPGDTIFFYVQGEGFAGIWTAAGEPYLADPDHLSEAFGKRLPYRVPIRRLVAYPAIVSEAEALDVLPERTADVLWSPIYRKLRGGRGCSTLLPPEAARLAHLLDRAGDAGAPPAQARDDSQRDARRISPALVPEGSWDESVLELTVLDELGSGGPLSALLGLDPARVDFLGNQVYAGVGMQAIDVLVSDGLRWVIIELKTGHLHTRVVEQMAKYGRHLRARLGLPGSAAVEHVALTKRPRRGSSQIAAARAELIRRSSADAGSIYRSVEWTRDGGALLFASVV